MTTTNGNAMWPHQREAHNRLAFELNWQGFLAMEMGTGKTLVALNLIDDHAYFEATVGKFSPVYVVVCPLPVCGVWKAEADRWKRKFIVMQPGSKTGLKRSVMMADIASYARSSRKTPTLIVLNYELFRTKKMQQQLRALPLAGIVFDESHKIARHKSLQSRSANGLCVSIRRHAALEGFTPLVVCSSGTVFSHSPLSVYGQMRAVDPDQFGAWTAFQRRYAILKNIPSVPVPVVTGYCNEQELQQIFSRRAFKCSCAEVQKDLPEVVTRRIRVQASASQFKTYKSLCKNMWAALNDEGDQEITIDNVLTKGIRLAQLSSGYLKSDMGEITEFKNGRADMLKHIVRDMVQATEPVVVFYQFDYELGTIKQAARALSRPCNEINGHSKSGLGPDGKLVVDYETVPGDLLSGEACGTTRASVCAVQVDAGAEGIDLTASRHAIFYRTSQSFASHAQAVKRLHRPGQEQTVFVYEFEMVGRDGETLIDGKILDSLQTKTDFNKQAMKTHLENFAT